MKRTKKAERLAHVQSWRTSGMSRPDYCRKHGLKYSTFLSWFKGETPIVEPGKFVALTSVHKNAGVICISFPNGIQVEYEGELNESLIQYLQHA